MKTKLREITDKAIENKKNSYGEIIDSYVKTILAKCEEVAADGRNILVYKFEYRTDKVVASEVAKKLQLHRLNVSCSFAGCDPFIQVWW